MAVLEYKFGKFYKDGVEIQMEDFSSSFDEMKDEIEESVVVPETPGGTVPILSDLPDDIPTVYFDGNLPTSKAEGKFKSSCHIRSSKFNIDCYATLAVQGNSSTAYNKKNFTINFYSDKECSTKMKIDFGWGPQTKYVMKANWIDITHSRNIVSARLWGDVVKARTNYDTLPSLLRTSPNQGAVDGFPIKFYGNNDYWGRYTMNIPKDAWMTNMDKTNNEHLILCGENYNEALFRAPAVWDETDWTDELHDEVPAELLARFNQFVSFVRESTNEEFKAGLSNYADVESILDYYIFSLLICNLDGFGKNHIWLSYDGDKFIASAYDMDSTFGLYWDGSQILASNYSRNSFEDMVSSRPGNLLYIKIAEVFKTELSTTFKKILDGPMSYFNVLNRFEDFIKIAPESLVKEDYADTTGSYNGACSGIPSKDTSNIQQIRSWYKARISYVKGVLGYIDEEDLNVEIPDTFAEWDVLQFDGNGTKRQPVNTGYKLFSNDPEWQTWTLFVHAKIVSNPDGGQRAAFHCMDESGSPWPGVVMQIQGNGDIHSTLTEIRMTKTDSGEIEGISFNNGAEEYIALKRNGSQVHFCIDGKNWNLFPGTLFEHDAPLVLGGYSNGNKEVLNGADGREINGYVTAKLWKENLDNVAKLFTDQFPETIYDYNHTWSMVNFDTLDSIQVGENLEVAMVNPNKSNGYLLGYNNGAIQSKGASTLELTKQNLDQHDGDEYKMIVSKVAETRTEQQEVVNQIPRTFTVTNGGSVTLAKQTSNINGYDLWRATLTRNGTRQVNVAFDGTLPQNIYLKAYRSNNTASSYTVSITGGTGTVTASTNNTVTSLSNFTQVTQTAATMNISCAISNSTGTYYLYVLIPNNITESVTTTESVEVPTGNIYYTIKSKVGSYGPTGTNGDATWSTTLAPYTISNATSITDSGDITENINAVNNPCMIRFTNESNQFLNAGGDVASLKFFDGTGAWSVWNLWQMDLPNAQNLDE